MENTDIIYEIFAWINDGTTYKAVLLVCRQWHSTAARYSYKIPGWTAHLETLFKHFGYDNQSWCRGTLAKNPGLPFDAILHDSWPYMWNWNKLSKNPAIKVEDMLKHPKLPWTDFRLANPNYTNVVTDMLCGRTSALDIHILSRNPNVMFADVRKFPEECYMLWDWRFISGKKDVTIDIILEHRYLPWDWTVLSSHPNITPGMILNYRLLPWNCIGMSSNPNFTIELYYALLDRGHTWDEFEWANISQHARISLKIIRANRNLPWDWYMLSMNNNITVREQIQSQDLPWDWDMISYHGRLTLDIVLSNPTIRWSWYYLSAKIHLDEISANPHLGWNWRMVSSNRTLTAQFVLAHLDYPWDLAYFGGNTFGKQVISK
jgi:hypothetical protein